MRWFSFLSIFLLAACAQHPKSPLQVDAKKVNSIFMADSALDADTCAFEIEARGGTVLYRNNLNVVMSDLKASDLNLALCESVPAPNHTIALDSEPENAPDLSTLLKLIPAEEIGARSFVKQNPKANGAGVKIAVLDTGVDFDHPILRTTPSGEPKVVAIADFSGEGSVSTTAVEVDFNDIFIAPEGTEYFVRDVGGEEYAYGLFPGSTIKPRRGESGVFVDLGVITYLKDGERYARVDLNNNKKFGDDEELSDFGKKRQMFKLGDKGQLTTGINLTEDGKQVTLVFDDGSHGTHVAGIAAGYAEGGLQGVAPGAQVISAKIGDNRLSGGSTTTASKMLAIDYAVEQGAHVINISYGIRAGSDLGQSAIDKYVDKVAKEKDVLFSISAGNEGPGVQTIGTPAGADLAISAGAYLSKETAKANYGFIGVEQNNMWFFSSVGPRTDGGFKPSIAAPGTALSSTPNGEFATYSGTSMAAPQVSGGLALILSAALDQSLATDRASITRALYRSAVQMPELTLIEQGHGLMSVPAAVSFLQKTKGNPPVEYSLSVTNVNAPNGRGKGILVRSPKAPSKLFSIEVGFLNDKDAALRTYAIQPSASWIKTPGSFWLSKTKRAFQVDLDFSALRDAGLYSEKITLIDESTGEIAVVVPVTVIQPALLNAASNYSFEVETTLAVGKTARHFVHVPAGATAVQVELQTDGPRVWAQLLDQAGREEIYIANRNTFNPEAPQLGQTEITKPGVYELDLVAPPNNQRPAKVKAKVTVFSLSVALSPPIGAEEYVATVQNNFEPLNVVPTVQKTSLRKVHHLRIVGDKKDVLFGFTKDDLSLFSELKLTFDTAKKYYDLMTDYPYMLFCDDGTINDSGGLQMHSVVSVTKACPKELRLELQGAFTKQAPEQWFVTLTEDKVLKNPVVLTNGVSTLLEASQQIEIPINFAAAREPSLEGSQDCVTLKLESPTGKAIQHNTFCK